MKILLINSLIRLSAKPNCIPYGLATIASCLINDGHEVTIYDVNALRPSQADIIKYLNEQTWDIAGVSGLITTFRFQKWLIPLLKQLNPDAPVISGGGLATSIPDIVYQNIPSVDVLVLGEGEQTMSELCKAIQNNQNLSEIDGIWYRANGKILKNKKREHIKDLNCIPFPAWELLPMDIYLSNPIWGSSANNSSGFLPDIKSDRSMNIITSRGCPYNCNYCYHLFGRSNYRFRSAQNVADEMKTLVDRYNVDFIGFVDDNMMASEERVIELCDILKEMNLPITWGCHGRVSNAKPEILKRMANAGAVWIGYGVESGSQSMLNAMNKKTSVKMIKEAIEETRKAGIFANTTFIFGYPGETKETINATINLKKELQITCGSFFATPYPGTPLYDMVKHKIGDQLEFIESLDDATKFTINLTGFDFNELFELKSAMDENRDLA